jgi:hypothetical protein
MQVFMVTYRNRYGIPIKITAMVVVCLMLWNDVLWANPDVITSGNRDTLARWYLTDNPADRTAYEAVLGVNYLSKDDVPLETRLRLVNVLLVEAASRSGTEPLVKFTEAVQDGPTIRATFKVTSSGVTYTISMGPDGISCPGLLTENTIPAPDLKEEPLAPPAANPAELSQLPSTVEGKEPPPVNFIGWVRKSVFRSIIVTVLISFGLGILIGLPLREYKAYLINKASQMRMDYPPTTDREVWRFGQIFEKKAAQEISHKDKAELIHAAGKISQELVLFLNRFFEAKSHDDRDKLIIDLSNQFLLPRGHFFRYIERNKDDNESGFEVRHFWTRDQSDIVHVDVDGKSVTLFITDAKPHPYVAGSVDSGHGNVALIFRSYIERAARLYIRDYEYYLKTKDEAPPTVLRPKGYEDLIDFYEEVDVLRKELQWKFVAGISREKLIEILTENVIANEIQHLHNNVTGHRSEDLLIEEMSSNLAQFSYPMGALMNLMHTLVQIAGEENDVYYSMAASRTLDELYAEAVKRGYVKGPVVKGLKNIEGSEPEEEKDWIIRGRTGLAQVRALMDLPQETVSSLAAESYKRIFGVYPITSRLKITVEGDNIKVEEIVNPSRDGSAIDRQLAPRANTVQEKEDPAHDMSKETGEAGTDGIEGPVPAVEASIVPAVVDARSGVALLVEAAVGSVQAPKVAWKVKERQPERIISAGHVAAKQLLMKSARYLGNVPVNEHIDISAIPKDSEQLEQNMKTIARLIAWNNAFGLNIRYVIENDTDGKALEILKSELIEVSKIPGVNGEDLLSRIGLPHAGDNVINIYLVTIDNIRKIAQLTDKEYTIALKDDPELPGVSIPNYTAASAIGLGLASLREAKEKEGTSGYESLRRKTFDLVSGIYKRFGIIKDDKEFTITDIEFMVTGCFENKIEYAIRYALPPIVKDLAERLQRHHEAMQLVLQAA